MIIVEGPDGSGKTTLINQLAKEFELEVNPRVVSKETNELTDLKTWVEENIAQGFQYKLFDRYRLISEFIYGPTLRKAQRSGFTDYPWVAWNLERLYFQVQPFIIYCLPSLETIKENLANDPDNTAVVDHTEQIYTAYLERAALDRLITPHNVMVWDYTKDDLIERRAAEESEHGVENIESMLMNPFRPMMDYAKGRAEL